MLDSIISSKGKTDSDRGQLSLDKGVVSGARGRSIQPRSPAFLESLARLTALGLKRLSECRFYGHKFDFATLGNGGHLVRACKCRNSVAGGL